MAETTCTSKVKKFRRDAILYTDGIGFCIVIPVAAFIYVLTTPLMPEQVKAFSITVALTSMVFFCFNVIWFRHLFKPFFLYSTLKDASKEIPLELKVKVKESKLSWQLVNVFLPLLLISVFGVIYIYLRRRKYAN